MVDVIRFEGRYRFLSNFHTSTVRFEGITYPTAEHAFQAAKTLDPEVRGRMAQEPTPGRAKRLGRSLELRPDWDLIRVSQMAEIVARKFRQHDDLADDLVATNGSVLVEFNNWHDTWWGVCVCEKHSGEGLNYLGTILMGVRASL